jgi:HSP20 family protein
MRRRFWLGGTIMTENTTTIARNPTSDVENDDGQCFTPRVDIVETEGELLLYADLPGVKSEDLDLRYEQGELILRGKIQPREEKGQLLFNEYERGNFYRVFQVQESIDASKIAAEFRNGELIVHLPKQESAKPIQVPIRVNNNN